MSDERTLADAERDLDEAYEENTKLGREIRSLKDKIERMHTRADQENNILAARTTALCALLQLPDPRWQPKKEEMEP